MTRRVFVRVLLSLLLVLSQQMAFTHALSHWNTEHAAETAGSKAGKQRAADQLCEQCAAFAQLAGVVGSDTRTFAATDPGSSLITSAEPGDACRRTICVFDSRAPPSLS